jgi:hypothetical protein
MGSRNVKGFLLFHKIMVFNVIGFFYRQRPGKKKGLSLRKDGPLLTYEKHLVYNEVK